MLCGVVENGVDADDPRVMVRVNEATKIILDSMMPVGGMATYDVKATLTSDLLLPPQLENCIEAVPAGGTKFRGDNDIVQGWYEIVNNSMFLDPAQAHDNPLIDLGSNPTRRTPRSFAGTTVTLGLSHRMRLSLSPGPSVSCPSPVTKIT